MPRRKGEPLNVRCQLSPEGEVQLPMHKGKCGTILGENKRGSWRVVWDGTTTPAAIAKEFIQTLMPQRRPHTARRNDHADQ